MTLAEILRLRANEIEARKGEGGPALVMLLREAAKAIEAHER